MQCTSSQNIHRVKCCCQWSIAFGWYAVQHGHSAEHVPEELASVGVCVCLCLCECSCARPFFVVLRIKWKFSNQLCRHVSSCLYWNSFKMDAKLTYRHYSYDVCVGGGGNIPVQHYALSWIMNMALFKGSTSTASRCVCVRVQCCHLEKWFFLIPNGQISRNMLILGQPENCVCVLNMLLIFVLCTVGLGWG